LGLAIAHQLVDLMHGRLGFESTPGAGSTFWFDVPLPAAAGPGTTDGERAHGHRPAAATNRTAPAGRVLLVEDSPVNQLVARGMLERLGYVVETADNGEEAVAAARSGRYDVVLMDCLMPVMDGYEATERIRRLEGWAAKVPIVAVTASAAPADRDRCLSAGMTDYVAKPLDPAALAAALERCREHGSDGRSPERGSTVPLDVLQTAPTPGR
jgi:CheY-like chemotaxis protein